MKSVIIVKKGEDLEAWGSLTELCDNHKENKFSYNYLKGLKFPFDYKGFSFRKVPYRKRSI
jgi:hypothetical protein